MSKPIEVDIPHKLGRSAMRQRLDERIGQITARVPGGGEVKHHWEGDTMHFTVVAVGQTVAGRLTVFDATVHAIVELPALLGMFSGQIKQLVEREAPNLLR